MLGVVILWLSILNVILLISGVVVIEVIKRIDFVSIPLCRRPHLVADLYVLSLLDSWVRTIRVAFVPSVTNHFIYHFYYLWSSYKP